MWLDDDNPLANPDPSSRVPLVERNVAHSEKTFWVEKAFTRDFPLRARMGFEHGAFLISPALGMTGHDRYKVMRYVNVGDIVLHLTNNEGFTNLSIVTGKLEQLRLGTEMWYRIKLGGLQKISPQIGRDSLFKGQYSQQLQVIAQTPGQNLFYERRLRLRQGAYLTPLPQDVLRIIELIYGQLSSEPLTKIIESAFSKVLLQNNAH